MRLNYERFGTKMQKSPFVESLTSSLKEGSLIPCQIPPDAGCMFEEFMVKECPIIPQVSASMESIDHKQILHQGALCCKHMVILKHKRNAQSQSSYHSRYVKMVLCLMPNAMYASKTVLLKPNGS